MARRAWSRVTPGCQASLPSLRTADTTTKGPIAGRQEQSDRDVRRLRSRGSLTVIKVPMHGIGAQRLLENTVSLPIAVWLEPICGRIVIELAAVLAGVSKVLKHVTVSAGTDTVT